MLCFFVDIFVRYIYHSHFARKYIYSFLWCLVALSSEYNVFLWCLFYLKLAFDRCQCCQLHNPFSWFYVVRKVWVCLLSCTKDVRNWESIGLGDQDVICSLIASPLVKRTHTSMQNIQCLCPSNLLWQGHQLDTKSFFSSLCNLSEDESHLIGHLSFSCDAVSQVSQTFWHTTYNLARQ